MFHKAAATLGLALTVAVGGCDERPVEPSPEHTRSADLLAQAVSGELLPKSEMQTRMQILAREVALALAEEDTRLSVYAAVQGRE